MSEKKGGERMPVTAAWVAELRAALGAEWVDGAIAASQRAGREYRARIASDGQARADAWLKRQSWPQGRFHAVEQGCEVGVCDGGGA